MNQGENEKHISGRQFVINEGYVEGILEGVFETDFTEEEWEELFYDRLGDHIYRAVYDAIQEMVDYKDVLLRNIDAASHSPHYIVKWKNSNAYVDDFKIMGHFVTEADAQKRIDYEQIITEDDEWKIEKVL